MARGASLARQFQDKDLIVFSKFDGMSTQSNRHDLMEEKAAWMENLQPVGTNNILCVPAPAAATTNLTGESITEEFFAPINGINYLICFCASGSAYAVNLGTDTKTQFAPAGTFSMSPDMTIWNLSRILIADPQAGYCTWDGTLFAKAGGVSPNILVTNGGSGYTSGATVAIIGGQGTGATATATVVGGIVTGITLTNTGHSYLATDVLTVTITPVGAGSGATATAHVFPIFTTSPTTLAVFEGRVWIASGNIINYTGTGASYGGIGWDDFLVADASGSFAVNDADLVHSITALRALNNYLFIIGDASVKQIGNISVSTISGVSSTNFTTVTLSSDQGTEFRNTVISYNRLVLFANTVGVYAIFGTSVEKISDDMDGIFRLTDFSLLPSAAVNDINNIHCYLLLLRYRDPAAGSRSLILAFMNKKWFVINQGNSVNFIATASIGGITETFSTSGADVTQILEDPTSVVPIELQTSLTSHQMPYIGKRIIRYAIAQSATDDNTLNILLESERSSQSIDYDIQGSTLQFINNSGVEIQFVNNSSADINFVSGSAFQYQTGNSEGIAGIYLGMTLTGKVSNFTLNSMILEYGNSNAFQNSGLTVGGA